MSELFKMSKRQYVFILKNIVPNVIDERYDFTQSISNLEESIENQPENTTLLEDLEPIKKTPDIISYLDETKRNINCIVSTPIQGNEMKSYHCFWCRHPLLENSRPIHCPTRYVPHQVVKTYYSELSKDKYVIKENITSNRLEKIMVDDSVSTIKNGYYITDGIFCSFNCCMAYIHSNKKDYQFKDSERLLIKMYNDTHIDDNTIEYIEPAHDWRMLQAYGGPLSIREFRKSFCKIEYIPRGNILKTVPLGKLFEEKIKF